MLRSLDQVTIATSNSIGNRPSIANVDGPMSVQPFDLGGANGGLPTALALPPTQGDPVRFGEEAFVSGADLALMTNWKLLLGKTDFEVMTERKNSDPLNRALERATLEDVTRLYFEFVLSGLRYFTAENSDFSDWFAVLMEDATETLGGFQLDGASFGQS